MELILMRHGTTQGNLERRFIGTLDVPLLPQGEELARRVGATLPAVEHIYRSPLQRCRRRWWTSCGRAISAPLRARTTRS